MPKFNMPSSAAKFKVKLSVNIWGPKSNRSDAKSRLSKESERESAKHVFRSATGARFFSNE